MKNKFWVLLLLLLLIPMTGCKKDEKEKKEENTEIPEYIALSKDLLNDQFDFAILGKDGAGYFYEFQDEDAIPQRLTIYDGSKNKVKLVVNFDEYGLPENILSEDFTIVLGNYAGNKFDAVLITKEGESQLFENVETDMDWDEYMNGTGVQKLAMTKGFDPVGWLVKQGEKYIVKPLEKVVNGFVDVCEEMWDTTTELNKTISKARETLMQSMNPDVVAVLGCLFTGFANIVSGIICNIIYIVDELGWLETSDAAFLKDFVDLATCGSDYLGCIGNILGLVAYEVEQWENSAQANIMQGGIILLQTGDGNAIHTGGRGVYVAGNDGGRAVLWKDGVMQYLTDGSEWASSNSVYVSGNDVYVVGYERIEGRSEAKMWKNGVVQNLGSGEAESVFVSGNDVYVAGTDGLNGNTVGKLWKNGALEIYGAQAHSVYVSGNDVYVAGYEGVQGDGAASLWKNGIAQNFSTSSRSNNSAAFSVYVAGSDVYVAGHDNRGALWKNGEILYTVPSSFAESVFVSGSDVYLAGYGTSGSGGRYAAKLWKNSVEQNLVGFFTEDAWSVYVSGSDVYVAGSEKNGNVGNSVAKIWKNGAALYLTDGTNNAKAYSVFVME